MENNLKNEKKVGITAWIALLVFLAILSGLFTNSSSWLKIFDFSNLSGKFGTWTIDKAAVNFMGKGGVGTKEGFSQAINIIPALMLFCGLLGVFENLGALKACEILFRPILKPLLGLPGACGVAFVSSFTSSDVASFMTRQLYEDGMITDDQRTVFVAYQYAASAVANNTISCAGSLLEITPIATGPIILIQVFCKLLGANVVRIILKFSNGKKSKEVSK